jgi:hypothetical protein
VVEQRLKKHIYVIVYLGRYLCVKWAFYVLIMILKISYNQLTMYYVWRCIIVNRNLDWANTYVYVHNYVHIYVRKSCHWRVIVRSSQSWPWSSG